MGIKGKRVHLIEEISDTVISFQRGNKSLRATTTDDALYHHCSYPIPHCAAPVVMYVSCVVLWYIRQSVGCRLSTAHQRQSQLSSTGHSNIPMQQLSNHQLHSSSTIFMAVVDIVDITLLLICSAVIASCTSLFAAAAWFIDDSTSCFISVYIKYLASLLLLLQLSQWIREPRSDWFKSRVLIWAISGKWRLAVHSAFNVIMHSFVLIEFNQLIN